MSQFVPSTPYSSIAAVLALAFAAGCGHTQETKDAFELSKSGITPGGNSSSGGSTTGGGGGGSLSCAPPAGPQFDCSAPASQQFDPTSMKAYCVPEDVAQKVQSTLSLMGPTERGRQMQGIDGSARDYRDIERSPDVEVSGVGTIRGYRYRDAGKGVNLDAGQDNRNDTGNNYATVFPAPSVRAASWDLELERRVGAAIGDETAASKNNMMLAPCMNIIRHPRWGRTQETYGEDMYAVGRMATAFTVGVQEYVVACAKHWAGNNIEEKRAKQNAIMKSEQVLREIYGRHFEMVVQDGAVGCIMASYNLVNGVKATQNQHLLRTVLKGPVEQGGFGFEGLVITDWWAMPGDQNVPDPATAQYTTSQAVAAGTDIEVPWTLNYSDATLANVDQTLVTEAAKRVLTQKFLFNSALTTDPWSLKPPKSVLLDNGSLAPNEEHEALAEEVSVKSSVLLTNGLDGSPPVLPLTSATNIAVVGPLQDFSLISSSVPKSCGFDEQNVGQGQIIENARVCTFNYATDPALGDRGSSRVNGDPERSYGPFKGIQQIAGASRTVTTGNTADAAANADAVVVVVGYSPADEGEEYAIAGGGDRSSLNLPEGQNEFVDSVLALNKPTVIIIESGSIVNLPWLGHANKNQATIWAGYPGQMGGRALGKLIFGEANFSGKVPMAWPVEAEMLPFKGLDLETEMGYFFGYREFDRRQHIDGTAVNLVFPFGHGLSYSSYEYKGLTLPCTEVTKDAIIDVTVDITNTSMVPGDEVAMLFVKPPPKPAGITGERPWKELKSFARVSVPAQQTETAHLPLRIRDLRRWEGDANGRWVIDSGDYTIVVAKDAGAADAALMANDPETVGTLRINGD